MMKHMKWLRGLALILALLLSTMVLAEAAELESSAGAEPVDEQEILDGELIGEDVVEAGEDLAIALESVELGEVNDELSDLETPEPAAETVYDDVLPPADAPAEPETPAAQDAPAEPETPAAQDAPVEPEIPAAQDMPAEQEIPAAQDAPAEPETPAAQDAPVEPETPAAQDMPAEPETPAAQDAPAESETPAAQDAPAEPETPAAQDAPDGTDGQHVQEPAEGQSAPAGTEETPAQEPAGDEDAAKPEEGAATEGEADGEKGAEGEEEAVSEETDAAEDLAVPNAAKPVFPRALVMGVKEGTRLDASGVLEGAIVYTSSKPKVVAVNPSTGQILARKKGTAVIAASNAARKTVYCTVTVMKAPKKVKLSTGWLALNPGAAARLGVILPKKSASLARAFYSSNPQVATVDGSGVVRAVRAGSTTVTVRTFNGKYASCKVVVLNGAAPKTLQLSRTSAVMGVKEKLQLRAGVEAGAAAAYAWATSNKRIATVSATGVVTAKKKGTVTIYVATHNGLRRACVIRVFKAPKKVALSASSLRMQVGATTRLSAWMPSGTGSTLYWSSSNAAVASVDGNGTITARAAGTARIAVVTYNRKAAYCTVTVIAPATTPGTTPAPTPATTPAPTPAGTSLETMLNNLRNSSAVGTKRDAIVGIVELLVRNGFEPAFAAGVAGNIKLEGNYGQFENSNYVSNPKSRPRYFAYLDGGNYYKNGELNIVYVPKESFASTTVASGVTKAYSYAEQNYYYNRYYKKYTWQVNLNELESFVSSLEKGGWTGMFGLGLVQWTASRTKTLMTYYRKHAGSASTMSQAQVIAAENEMIMAELKGSYASVYTRWKNENAGSLTGAAAAASAASIFCLYYEKPANKESAAVARASEARTLYNVMMG